MSDKKIICALAILFVISGTMLLPVVLPYFTIETSYSGPSEYTVDGLSDFARNLKEQTTRNISRLQLAQTFAQWFVISFAVFTTSSIGLLIFGFKALQRKKLTAQADLKKINS